MQSVSSAIYDYDMLFKALLIGESGVGKSCFCTYLIDKKFNQDTQPTVGIDFKSKNFNLESEKVKVMLYDCSGQERFHNICSMYYQGSNGIIFAYDITDRDSFSKISSWIKECENVMGPNVPRVLVGNKADLEEKREVTYAEGRDLSRKFRIKFYECSSKKGTNIDEAFGFLLDEMVEDRDHRIYEKMVNKKQREQAKPQRVKAKNTIFCCMSDRNK